jgi:hypothetical protein
MINLFYLASYIDPLVPSSVGRVERQETRARSPGFLPWRGAVSDLFNQPRGDVLRASHEISVSNISCIWTNCIVPFSVERVGTNIYFFNLFF